MTKSMHDSLMYKERTKTRKLCRRSFWQGVLIVLLCELAFVIGVFCAIDPFKFWR